jgi:hypothetical protein
VASPNVVKFPGQHKSDRLWSAIYTFAFATLVGPAIGAAILGAITIIAGLLHKGPPSLVSLKTSELWPYAAERVLSGYIWSAIPAGLTAIALAAMVWKSGTFHWLWGAVAAAVAATVMAVYSGGVASDHATFIALVAAASAVLGRMALAATKVVE